MVEKLSTIYFSFADTPKGISAQLLKVIKGC